MSLYATDTPRPQPSWAGPGLLVGYGNLQRGDDGLGPRVAALVARELGPDTAWRVLARPRLDPELLDDLARADRIILVDATVGELPEGWEWQVIQPSLASPPILSHDMTPAYLLGLLGLIHGRSPQAWMLAVAGHDFAWGEGLSPQAASHAQQAASELVNLLGGRNDHGLRT
jgi:hydrogenase maturation protease